MCWLQLSWIGLVWLGLAWLELASLLFSFPLFFLAHCFSPLSFFRVDLFVLIYN